MLSHLPLRRRALAVAVLLISIGRASAERADLLPTAIGVTERVSHDVRTGLAISGYDPVTYLLETAPRPGLPENEVLFEGVVWRFVSAANRNAFLRDPAQFLPRFGGFDAAGVADGRVVDSDPTCFVVRSGRVYLFRSADNRDLFVANAGMAAVAENRWPGLRATLGQG